MSFDVGALRASLTLDGVDQFNRDLDGVGRRFSETGQKGSAFGRLGEQAVRTVAGATTGLITAAAAYAAILVKTGVGYNSLQQNSRAALSVLLGGAEKANEQMGRLDDFARNSPFSKSVFIQAQQQLLGFGMEAAKVIPTLDAVQQAVAAMGGSNEQISEVVNILAKVQSTGKFTAETLNELGYRGIDAATLMGNAMGKTAQQMRDDISEGAIGGAEAIEVLTTAMQTRFGGAADGVKEQWSGAVDRIKAAQRDLGSHLAEPFVSAQGGGMAVTWANQIADNLRAIEKQAVPVMGILTQRGMPFFAALTQGLDASGQAIKRWNPQSLEVALDRMAGHAPGIAALAGAVLALGANVGPLGQMLKVLNISLNPVLAAIIGLTAASPELRGALMDLLAAGKPLIPVVGELATALSGTLTSSLPLVASGVDLVTAVLTPLVRVIASVPTPVLAGALAFLAMHRAAQQLAGPLGLVLTSLQRFAQGAAVQAALGQTSIGMGALSRASMTAQGSVVALGNSLKAAFLSNPVGIALTVVATAVAAWASANAAAQQKVEEHRAAVASLKDSLNQTTGAATQATQQQIEQNIAASDSAELWEKLGVTHSEVARAAAEGGSAYEDLTKKVRENSEAALAGKSGYAETSTGMALSAKEGKSLVEVLEQQRAAQEEAQAAVRAKVQADREAAAAMSESALSNQRFNDALQVARDVTADAETRVRALKQALDELKGGSISAEEAQKRLSETNLTLAEGLAQTDEAGAKLWQSTLDGAGKIDLSSRAGLAFADSMGRSRDAMLDAARAASDKALADGDVAGAARAAREAGEGYIATLQETMRQAGLTEEQIAGLTSQYLDVPAMVSTLLTTEGTFTEAEQQALDLLNQLLKIPEGQKLTIESEGSEEAVQQLRDLGYVVEETPDGKHVEITSAGEQGVLDALANINGTYVPDKVLQVDADTVDAFKGIDGVNVAVIDGKTAYVYGENSQARAKIDEINAKQTPGKTTYIGANDSGFWNAWRAIQAASAIEKIVNIVEQVSRVTKNDSGGLHTAAGQHFAAGGFPSGLYRGVTGGIPKMGVDGTRHVFAEAELGVPWEVYISGNPAFRERNIKLAQEALRMLGAPALTPEAMSRLAFPAIPASALGGVRGFAEGGVVNRPGSRATDPRLLGAERNLNLKVSIEAHRGLDVDAIAELVTEKVIERVEEVL